MPTGAWKRRCVTGDFSNEIKTVNQNPRHIVIAGENEKVMDPDRKNRDDKRRQIATSR